MTQTLENTTSTPTRVRFLIFGLAGIAALLLAAAIMYLPIFPPRYGGHAIGRVEILLNEQATPQNSKIEGPISRLQAERGKMVAILTSKRIHHLLMETLSGRYKGVGLDTEFEVSVEPVREMEDMLDIRVDAATEDYAMDCLKELMEQYKNELKSRMLEQNIDMLRSLWEEEQRLSDERDAAEVTLMGFRKDHDILRREGQRKADEESQAGLFQRLNAVRVERVLLESSFPALRKADPAVMADMLRLAENGHPGKDATPMPVRPTFEEAAEFKSACLEVKKTQLQKECKPDDSRMIELEKEIAQSKLETDALAAMTLKRLQAHYEALKIQEAALEEAIADWTPKTTMSIQDQATYDNKRAELENLAKLHDEVCKRIIDIKASNTNDAYIHFVEPPHAFR